MTDQRPDGYSPILAVVGHDDEEHVVAFLVEDDDGPIELREPTDGEPIPAGALVVRDTRGPREIHWRAARARYEAAVRRRDRTVWGTPECREAEAAVRHAGRLLEAETGLSQAYLDFVRDA